MKAQSEKWRGRETRKKPVETFLLEEGKTVKEDERWLRNARSQLNKRIQTPKAWTPREITILREYYGKVLAKDLAKIIGRPLGSILKKAQLVGLKSGLSFGKAKPNT